MFWWKYNHDGVAINLSNTALIVPLWDIAAEECVWEFVALAVAAVAEDSYFSRPADQDLIADMRRISEHRCFIFNSFRKIFQIVHSSKPLNRWSPVPLQCGMRLVQPAEV